jgi:hypothetical protein
MIVPALKRGGGQLGRRLGKRNFDTSLAGDTLPDLPKGQTHQQNITGAVCQQCDLGSKQSLSSRPACAAMTLSEFLARAWKAANDKARELGWIV